jgi:hypothetical protein
MRKGFFRGEGGKAVQAPAAGAWKGAKKRGSFLVAGVYLVSGDTPDRVVRINTAASVPPKL